MASRHGHAKQPPCQLRLLRSRLGRSPDIRHKIAERLNSRRPSGGRSRVLRKSGRSSASAHRQSKRHLSAGENWMLPYAMRQWPGIRQRTMEWCDWPSVSLRCANNAKNPVTGLPLKIDDEGTS
jgi:hypothetical protein